LDFILKTTRTFRRKKKKTVTDLLDRTKFGHSIPKKEKKTVCPIRRGPSGHEKPTQIRRRNE